MWRLPFVLVILAPTVVVAAPPIEVELAAGVGDPVAGSDYADGHDAGLKLGLRGVIELGSRAGWRLGVELAGDWIDRESHLWASVGETQGYGDSTYRLRGLVGLRLQRDLGKDVQVFVRALGGFDRLWTESIPVQPPGEPTELSEIHQRETVRAAELSLGASYRLGHLRLGVQLGLPMAFYPASPGSRGLVLDGSVEEPIAEQAASRIFVHDTVIEVDALLTVGAAF